MDLLLKIQGHKISWFILYILISGCLQTLVASETVGNNMTLNTILKANQSQTLISPSGIFEIGFYAKNQSNEYTLAIWYANIPTKTIVWMADTSMSVSDNSYLLLSSDGELQVFNGSSMLYVWTSYTDKVIDHKLYMSMLEYL